MLLMYSQKVYQHNKNNVVNTFTTCECVDNFLHLIYNKVMNVSLTKVCSFFGHRKIEKTEKLKRQLATKIKGLTENENYNVFYFGGFGEFDELCYEIVSELRIQHRQIKRIFCLSDERYLCLDKRPEWLKRQEYEEYVYLNLDFDYWYTRIYYRNCEMIKNSDFIIFYVDENKDGGAKKALNFARKIKKENINMYEKAF